MRSRPGWSSPFSKVRPRAAPRPRTVKRLAETVLPTRRTASPLPVRLSSGSEPTPATSSVRLCSCKATTAPFG